MLGLNPPQEVSSMVVASESYLTHSRSTIFYLPNRVQQNRNT